MPWGAVKRWSPSANALRHAHAIAAGAWLLSIVFVSACSLYANFASHAAAWQASRAEDAQGDT